MILFMPKEDCSFAFIIMFAFYDTILNSDLP